MFPQVRIDLVDPEFGLERRDVLEAVCFWPRDGGLGVDPGVFADEFEHRCREVGVPAAKATLGKALIGRSEEHTSELQSLMRISYAVICLQKNTHIQHQT